MNFHSFFRKWFHNLKDSYIFDAAATLAFYFILAIFPLMVCVLASVSFFRVNTYDVHQFITSYVPGELGDMFGKIVLNTIGDPKTGLFSIGIIGTLWSASNAINAFIRSVNHAYKIEETRHFLHLRVIAIILTIGMILLIVLALALPVFGNVILLFLEDHLHLSKTVGDLLSSLRWVVTTLIICVVLSVLYKIAPNQPLRWYDGLAGALFATASWQLISFLFSLYLSHFAHYENTYGPIAGVIVLMLWFYFTGMILIIGAKLNATFYQLRKKIA
ncbi:YihY/virulence factor BrkB family protein [Bacillus sp. FSL W7-1360]